MNNLNNNDAFFAAEAAFHGVHVVYQFMENQKDKIMNEVFVRPKFSEKDNSLKMLWERLFLYMKALTKLDDISFFQTISSINRSMFEISVDLTFLYLDKTNETGERIVNFVEFERFESCKKIVKYYEEKKIEIPDAHKICEDVIRNNVNVEKISKIKNKYWQNNKQVKRWSGLNDLSLDVERLHKVAEQQNVSFNWIYEILNLTFDEYYHTRYKKLSWNVHSGVSFLITNSDSNLEKMPNALFELSVYLDLVYCSTFGLLCTKIILKDFEIDKHWNEFDKVFEEIVNHRNYLIARAVSLSK